MICFARYADRMGPGCGRKEAESLTPVNQRRSMCHLSRPGPRQPAAPEDIEKKAEAKPGPALSRGSAGRSPGFRRSKRRGCVGRNVSFPSPFPPCDHRRGPATADPPGIKFRASRQFQPVACRVWRLPAARPRPPLAAGLLSFATIIIISFG